MRRAAILTVLVAALLVAPAAATAARPPIPGLAGPPPGAPVVAGPTPSGAVLRAWRAGDQLCTAIVERGSPSEDGDCSPIAAGVAPFAFAGGSGSSSRRDRTSLWSGIVGSGIETVEIVRNGGGGVRVPATAAPADAGLGDRRFYLAELPADDADYARLLDATGTVRRAQPLSAQSAIGRILGRTLVVARGRAAGVAWTARSFERRRLQPTPLEPERFVALHCVKATAGRVDNEVCDDGPAPLDVRFQQSCSRPGTSLVTALSRPAARAVVVLGDGRRVTARPLARLGAGRQVALVLLPGATAVRRVVAVDRAGRAVARLDLGLPPAGAQCARTQSASASFGFAATEPEAPRPPGRGPLVVRDDPTDQVKLCAGFAPLGRRDCQLPPVDPFMTLLATRDVPGARAVYGVVSTDVATVVLERSDGVSAPVAVTAPPAGTTRYAGVVGLLDTTVPRGVRVISFRLLDAAGRELLARDGPDDVPPGHDVTLLRLPGLPALHAARIRASAPIPARACITVGRAMSTRDCWFGGRQLQARCAERRIVITALLAHTTDRLAVRLGDGREVGGRTVALPRALGPGAAAVVVLGPHDAPAQLITRGTGAHREPLALPPVAAQCGYRKLLGPLG